MQFRSLFRETANDKVLKLTEAAQAVLEKSVGVPCQGTIYLEYNLTPKGTLHARLVLSQNSVAILPMARGVTPDKCHTVIRQLYLAWVVQVAWIRQSIPAAEAVQAASMGSMLPLSAFIPFAYKQLLHQEYENASSYFVSQLSYVNLIVDRSAMDGLLSALVGTITVMKNGYSGNPADAWRLFWHNCQERGIANLLRLTKQDAQAISQWLDGYVRSNGSTADYSASIFGSICNDKEWSIWSSFWDMLARDVIPPRCKNAYKIA